MTTSRTRSLRHRLASAALLLAGIIALIAMGPQFIVFIPVLLIAWFLARVGLLPRAVHARDTDIRILGGPAVGSLRCADVRIHADPDRADVPATLLLLLVRELSHRTGAEPRLVAAGATESAPFAAIPAEVARLLREDGFTLVWRSGATPALAAGASDHAAARWHDAWPAAVAAQAAFGATIALQVRREDGGDADAAFGLLGEAPVLGAALAQFTRECRDAGLAAAWTSGWVRDIEREAARQHAVRTRRARPRDRAS